MKFQVLILLGISSFLFQLSISGNAQTRAELEKSRTEIIKEIDATNSLLQETVENQKAIASDLSIITQQIENRNNLSAQISLELDLIENNILEVEEIKTQTQENLNKLLSQYNQILRAMYRNKRLTNPLLQFLSTKKVSENFLKTSYYNQLKSFVVAKLESIKVEQNKLNVEIQKLNESKNDKVSVSRELEEQFRMLENEEARQIVLINSLKEDESALKIALEKQKNDRESMNKAIEDIINSNFGNNNSVSANNKGSGLIEKSLNWPVEGGVISSRYGKQRHPTISGLYINNNGVDIRAPKGGSVLCVKEGKVVSVSSMQGFGKMIIIEHLDFYTVYSKLKETNVIKDQVIKSGETIGFLDEKDNISELHFEIWKNNKTLNPKDWLK